MQCSLLCSSTHIKISGPHQQLWYVQPERGQYPLIGVVCADLLTHNGQAAVDVHLNDLYMNPSHPALQGVKEGVKEGA